MIDPMLHSWLQYQRILDPELLALVEPPVPVPGPLPSAAAAAAARKVLNEKVMEDLLRWCSSFAKRMPTCGGVTSVLPGVVHRA